MSNYKTAKDVERGRLAVPLANDLKALASKCEDVAVMDATIVDVGRWERNATQLRFVAELATEGA